MPAADVVLLPICIGLTLIGVIVTGIGWRRGRRGRVVQGIGLSLAPVALYLTGLLRLLWDAVVAVAGWAGSIVLSPVVWLGFSLLALGVVLFVVGGFLAARAPATKAVKAKPAATPAVAGRAAPAATTSATRTPAKAPAKGQAAPVDDDMAEIEAILRNRGIQ